VVVMKDGWVQQVGEPLELYNEPANRFVAGFIGSPAMNFADIALSARDGALWAANDGLRIRLPDGFRQRLGRYEGKHLTLGIRPEDLRVADAADPVELSFDAVVEVIERLGSEILLDVTVGPSSMVASVEPTSRAKVHDRVRLALNPDRLHFFDTESEAAV
jgi:multiple sugar transport system ATP-binding protein